MEITQEHAARRIEQIINIILSKKDIIEKDDFYGKHEEIQKWQDLIVFYSQFVPGHVD